MNRRRALGIIIASLTPPAICRAEWLMPLVVRRKPAVIARYTYREIYYEDGKLVSRGPIEDIVLYADGTSTRTPWSTQTDLEFLTYEQNKRI